MLASGVDKVGNFFKVTDSYQTLMDLLSASLCLKAKPPTSNKGMWVADIKSQARSSPSLHHRLTGANVQDTTSEQN